MEQKNNIVLIGMPGAGKSSLGVVVAKLLGYNFEDTDLLIQAKYDKMLWELIEQHGPQGYIQLENDVLQSLDFTHTVIATGGSAVYSEEGMQHLRQLGTVVYIKASLEELASRIGEIHERGVVVREGVQGGLESIFADREPLYERYAEITVDTTGLSAHEAADAIIAALSGKAER